MLSAKLYDMVKKNPAAVALGRLGGKKASKSMSDEEKTARAKKAAAGRWKDKAATPVKQKSGQIRRPSR